MFKSKGSEKAQQVNLPKVLFQLSVQVTGEKLTSFMTSYYLSFLTQEVRSHRAVMKIKQSWMGPEHGGAHL